MYYKFYWLFWAVVDALWIRPLCKIIHSHKWIIRITRLQSWAIAHSPAHSGFCCKTHFIFLGMACFIGRAERYDEIGQE